MAYLDETGLSHLWSKVTGLVDNSSSSGGGAFECLYYNESGTTGTVTLSATASKVLVVTGCGVTTNSLLIGLSQTNGKLYLVCKTYTLTNQTLNNTTTTITDSIDVNGTPRGSMNTFPCVYAVYKLS